MSVESLMYFALGLLAAGLLALMVMPAVWRRAVRLTQKRIEAATPMTMAEFRADKDQLRAEFALSTRRLEMNVEALRKRLAEQLRDINRKKSDLSSIKSDRDNHLTIIRELEEREGELRRRVLDMEKESAEMSQKLRKRDREFSDKARQLDAARDALRQAQGHAPIRFDGRTMSGDYQRDIEELITAITIERKRAAQLETQNQGLIEQLEGLNRRSAEAFATADELRRSLAERDDDALKATSDLAAAEARIIDAEGRITSLLSETSRIVENGEERTGQMLAEKLSLEAELDALRAKVSKVEETVMADWDTDRVAQSHLRERLNDIASDVSRLVYVIEGKEPVDNEESLFDRVQRFADDGVKTEEFPVRAALERKTGAGAVSDRMTALRDIQTRG